MNPWIASVLGIVPGSVLVVAGAAKVVDISSFQDKLLLSRRSSPSPRMVARLIVGLELLVGMAALIVSAAWTGIALSIVYLCVVIAAVIGWRRHAGDCGCFGRLTASAYGWQKLARNCVLFAMAVSYTLTEPQLPHRFVAENLVGRGAIALIVFVLVSMTAAIQPMSHGTA